MKTRKVDDNIVLQLLREGKNQKQIAEHFKVSPVAIHKRLKKILPKPESLEKLTFKEQNFCLAVAEGKSRINAALEAYDVKDRESAKALQNQLMKKDDIRIAINELMQIYGLTRGYRIHKLKGLVDHVDPVISLKALDTSFKLDGLYKEAENPGTPSEVTISLVVCHAPDTTRKLTASGEENTEGPDNSTPASLVIAPPGGLV